MESLYRKYRPQNFDEVIGQETIVQSLENAIKNERIAHAFIFNGSRGTGKTSVAQIFAKTLNCEKQDGNLCGECQYCLNLSTNELVDIVELDGASNNGVDEIRKIIENAKYLPIFLKYKVFIIDEVHMLTKGAFNSLLKTLEEPPAHVKFILATTEINRIPATILSRCQRFDFSLIQADDLTKHFTKILQKEEINYEETAVEIVAKLANGSVRDGLSMLDRLISYSETIDLTAVEQTLKITTEESYQKVYEAIVTGDSLKVMELFHQIHAKGLDEYNFLVAFQYYLRDELLKDEVEAEYKIKLVKLITEISKIIYNLRFVVNGHIYVEASLISLTLTMSESDTQNVAKIPEIKINQKKKVNLVEEIVVNNDSDKNFDKITLEESADTDEEESSGDVQVEAKKKKNELPLTSILRKATKEGRENYSQIFKTLYKDLTAENKNGLARFFSISEVRAASHEGIIVAIDQEYYQDYNECIEQLEEIICQKVNQEICLHLLTFEKWQEVREDYKKSLATAKGKKTKSPVKEIAKTEPMDEIEKIQSIFGKENVQIK